MPEGLVTSIEEAVALSEAELSEAIDSDSTPSTPDEVEEALETDDQAPEEASEQPTDETAPQDVEELFDEEILGAEEEEAQAPPDLASMTIEVPGVEKPVTVQELRDGYLRQADYTKKTQALASDRQAHEDATKFWTALQGDPAKVIHRLAIEAGLVAENAAVPKLEISPYRTAEEAEAEIARRVEEQLKDHPEVTVARRAEAQRIVDDELSRIASEHEVTLGPKSRQTIIREAQRTGSSDLEMVFLALRSKQEARRKAAEKLKGASGAKGSSSVNRETAESKPEEVSSLMDAVRLADLELAEAV